MKHAYDHDRACPDCGAHLTAILDTDVNHLGYKHEHQGRTVGRMKGAPKDGRDYCITQHEGKGKGRFSAEDTFSIHHRVDSFICPECNGDTFYGSQTMGWSHTATVEPDRRFRILTADEIAEAKDALRRGWKVGA